MPQALERTIVAGYAVALGFLLIIGGSAWWSVRQFSDTFRWVDHTHEVLYQLEETLTGILVIQSNSRGFALTANDNLLRTYEADEAALRGTLVHLRELIRDNPAQLERFDRLDPLITRAIDLQRERIAARRKTGLEGVAQSRPNLTGGPIMDQVRQVVATMEAAERRLLTERSAEAQAAARRSIGITLTGGIAALALVTTAGLVVRRDFRQRMQAEAERDRFFSISLDLLCIASADGYFKRVSPGVTDILGWSPAEFMSRPYLELVHPDDQAATRREVERQVLAGEKVLKFENRYRHKDGSWRVLSWRSVPHPDGLMYATARDVTSQKAAEAALRASEAEYRTLFESIDEGYCIIEVLFDERDRPVDYRFLSINPAFEMQTGLADAQGKRMRELAPAHEAHWFEIYGRIALTGEPERFQNHAAQLHRWFDVYAFRYGDPKNRQVAILFTNITERKQREEEIARLNLDLREHADQLEAANKELEAFSYSVSHDLRAPLRHIDGFAGLLQKNAAAGLDDQARRHLTVISSSARQMGRLIDDLLNFSRMGRTQLQPMEVDQDALVAAIIRDSGFEKSGRTINWVLPPLPRVRADHGLLRQVWVNLLDNAVKYTGKTPQPLITIGSRPEPGTCEQVFFVRDNGAGFDMRYADKLFGVFQRLHGPAEFEGTGIGLANVRRIITRHGGRTWAEGAVGAGATIYFSLPTTPAIA